MTDDQFPHWITHWVLMLWKCQRPSLSDPAYLELYSFVLHVMNSAHKNLTPPVLLTAMYYIDQLRKATAHLVVPYPKSEYRIFTTAVILADSFLNDHSIPCVSWAKVCGFPARECAIMKKEFLGTIGFSLRLSVEDYIEWSTSLVSLLQRQPSVMLSPPVSPSTCHPNTIVPGYPLLPQRRYSYGGQSYTHQRPYSYADIGL